MPRLFAVIALFLATCSPLPAGPVRPNVLFLAIDDLNDWVGFLGGCPGKVHTPNLDRLAARGTAFTNAHCAAPVCCPSRAAVLSGLLPTTTGLYNNQQWWKPNLPDLRTIPIHFREHGYHTTGAGKIYHHTAGNNPPNQWDHFQRNHFNDNGWLRHGSALYPWTKQKTQPKEFPYSGIKLYSGEADWGVLPLEESDYDDSAVADYSVTYLNHLRTKTSPPDELPPASDQRAPFFLAAGIFHPHMPWYVPRKYLDLYPLEDVVLPEPNPDDLADVPVPGRKLALRKSGDLARLRETGKWRTAVQHYLASITFADAQIGRILDALARSPAAQNTVIVLWSDHGWHLGEKGHWHKRTLWEEATRVPFIIVAPNAGKANQRCAQAVSLIDIFPTLIELCGLPPVAGLDGISLVPWLMDPAKERTRPAITVGENGHLAVRTTRYRLIQYTSTERELYDHQTDPNEWRNLAGTANATRGVQNALRWLPKVSARPAATKKSFEFDPGEFSFKHKKTGAVTRGQSAPPP